MNKHLRKNIIKKLLIVIVFVLSIRIFTDVSNYYNHINDLSDLHFLIIQNIANIEHMSTIDKAVTIRNHLYNRIPLKDSPLGYSFVNFDYVYNEAISGNVGHICGGLTILYIASLESQKIPARYIGIFSDTSDNHASVEFWDGTKWIASDPSFNVVFRHKNKYLSWLEVWNLVKENKSSEIIFDGAQTSNRRLQDYYIPFSKLVNRIVIHPACTNERCWPLEVHPISWEQGKTLAPYKGVYEILGSGLLR